MDLLKELSLFKQALKEYKNLLSQITFHQPIPDGYQSRRESLLVASSHLVPQIKRLTNRDESLEIYEFGKPRTRNMWEMGLRNEYDYRTEEAIDACIDNVTVAIGNLKTDIEMDIRDEQGNIIGEPPKDTAELPVNLFDKMQFHPKVVGASKDCFIAGNYREAILNAFICLIDCVKERTGLDLDGDDLMNQVFSFNYDKEQRRITKYPIIRLNELKNKSDLDEQQGFMFLCKGAVGGIRNPKAHKIIPQSNPLHTLEFLAFASLLIKKVEEGTVVKTSLPRTKWGWDRFLADTKSKCELEIVRLAVNLYDFTRSNSDFISWGTGNQDGSFTFRKLGLGGMISIFSMYSCGWIYINFGSLKNKNVPGNIMDSFRDNLNTIQNINIPKESVTNSKFARIYEKPLTHSKNLKLFQDAIISLCQQIE